MIQTECWVLPRPRVHRLYPGGFPLHFEKKLLREFKYPKKILHPFGGLCEYGIACDLKKEVMPDVIADAHYLPFANETFDFVIFDPPYSAKDAERMYGTPYISMNKCIKESVRVLKKGKFLALYHRLWIPKPKNTEYYKRIIVLPGQWHEARICHIFMKV